MTVPDSAEIRVLDLTKPDSPDATYFDVVDPSIVALAALPGRVVVIDRVAALMTHHRGYARLAALAQVEKVICIAVGDLSCEQRRLRQPTSLATIAATVWVGDPHGVSWAGGADRASTTGWDNNDRLPDLLKALRIVEVFDEVYRRTRECRYQTASPGLDVEWIDVAEEVLTQRRAAALRGITATGMAARNQQSGSRLSEFLDRAAEPTSGAGRHSPGSTPVAGELRQARLNTHTQLQHAARAMQRLAGVAGLVGAAGGVRHVVPQFVAAGNALGAYLTLVTETVRLVGSNLVTGHPPVHELVRRGLPQPITVDRASLANDVKAAVSADLRAGHPLPEISSQLHSFAVRTAPQGVISAQQALASSRVDALVARLTSPGRVDFGWPTPLALLSGMTVGTTFGAAVLPGSGGIAGPLLSLGWMLMTALLLIRCSCGPGVAVAVDWMLVVVGIAAAVGVISGRFFSPTAALPTGVEPLVVVLSVATLLGTGIASWITATRRWSRTVRIQDALSGYQRVNAVLDEAISAVWQPAAQHRLLADTAQAVASVIKEVEKAAAEVLAILDESSEKANAQSSRVVDEDHNGRPELVHVLRQDFAELAILAITPCLDEIRRGGQISMKIDQYSDHVRRLLTDYSIHLETRGVHALPPGIIDEAPRQMLRTVMWQQSRDSRRILLSDQYSTLVQLCAAGDVRLLNIADAEAFRFAPEQAREVFGADNVTWTSGNAVGVLRLVPLRPGLVDIVAVQAKNQNVDGVRH